MAIWLAAMLAAAGLPPEDERFPRSLQDEESVRPVEAILGVRTGVWTGRGFEFESIRSDSTQASSDQAALFCASILGGLEFYDHFVFLLTYEADLASKVTAQVGGAFIGWRENPKEKYGKGVPDE